MPSRNKIRRRRFLAAGLVGFTAGCLGGDSDEGEDGGADDGEDTEHVVTMEDVTIDPEILAIEPGDVVRWDLVSRTHGVTAFHEDNDYPTRIPEGAEPWDSGFLTGGEQFTHQFEVEGVYDYYCKRHIATTGGVGTIVVGEPSPDEPGLQPPQDELDDVVKENLEELNERVRSDFEISDG